MRPHLGSLACGIDGYAGAENAGEVGEEGHGQVGDGEADSILPSGGGYSYRLGGVHMGEIGDVIAWWFGTNNPFIIVVVEEILSPSSI